MPWETMTNLTSDALVGHELEFWTPARSAHDISATSLPHLKYLKFEERNVCWEGHSDNPDVRSSFVRKLASLQPPLLRVVLAWLMLESEDILATLLAACPTIQELDLLGCGCPITDATLAVLAIHPPLRSLGLVCLGDVTDAAIASFIYARGYNLRSLGFGVRGAVGQALNAVRSHALNIEALDNQKCSELFPTHPSQLAFTPGNVQMMTDLFGSGSRADACVVQRAWDPAGRRRGSSLGSDRVARVVGVGAVMDAAAEWPQFQGCHVLRGLAYVAGSGL
ncbi:hypothetical protein BDK51DRAFT_44502 [Blyttiomyces helicus]|uniref:F-box domain-containing protein n=1 Tax=Blyttiomyces helicus TaxID=388810 RepID=A0A4P9W6B9_9FUNG|nr:hypothetical protein BDK51DRAFT_44502 [Blyttiomyces helicus]|eukprot:RKO87854.1 hypothetical protein BDK51DRAFT_44502 [Blyttiomyces helicus]